MESFGRPAPSRGREALAADAASRKRVRLTEERIIDRDEERLRRALSQLEGRKASLREDRRQFEEQQEAKENYVAEEIEKTKLLLAISVGRRTTRANNERLDELPQEIWEKVFDKLGEHDLFPLALSCRYFRQKQVELVAPTRQGGPESEEPRLALRTSLKRKLDDGQPASAEYLRFCSMEEGVNGVSDERALHIRCLAAFHGYLPLLQELLSAAPKLNPEITRAAGKSSFSQSRLLLVWILTSFSSS